MEKHKWSSYPAYVNAVKAPLWLSRSLTYSMLGDEDCYAKYKAFVQNGVDAVTAEFYGGDSLTGIFGEKDFRQMIYDHRDCQEVAHELLSLVNQRPEPEEIVSVVAAVFGVSREDVLEKRRGRQPMNFPRQVAIYCCQRLGGHTQREVANYFSLTHRGSVSSAVRIIESRVGEDDLRKRLYEVRQGLNFTKLT